MSYKANVSYPELSPISRKLLLHFTVERIKILSMLSLENILYEKQKEPKMAPF